MSPPTHSEPRPSHREGTDPTEADSDQALHQTEKSELQSWESIIYEEVKKATCFNTRIVGDVNILNDQRYTLKVVFLLSSETKIKKKKITPIRAQPRRGPLIWNGPFHTYLIIDFLIFLSCPEFCISSWFVITLCKQLSLYKHLRNW